MFHNRENSKIAVLRPPTVPRKMSRILERPEQKNTGEAWKISTLHAMYLLLESSE